MRLYNVFVASDATDSLNWCGQIEADDPLTACARYNAWERNCEPGERYLVIDGTRTTAHRFVYMLDEPYGNGDPEELKTALREEA